MDDIFKDDGEPKVKLVNKDDEFDERELLDEFEEEQKATHRHIETDVKDKSKIAPKKTGFAVKALVGVLVVAGVLTTVTLINKNRHHNKTDNKALLTDSTKSKQDAAAKKDELADNALQDNSSQDSQATEKTTQVEPQQPMMPDMNGNVTLPDGRVVNINKVDTSHGPKMLLSDGSIVPFDPAKAGLGAVVINGPGGLNTKSGVTYNFDQDIPGVAKPNPEQIKAMMSGGMNANAPINGLQPGQGMDMPPMSGVPGSKEINNKVKEQELAALSAPASQAQPAQSNLSGSSQETMMVLNLAAKQNKMEAELTDLKTQLTRIEKMLSEKGISATQSSSSLQSSSVLTPSAHVHHKHKNEKKAVAHKDATNFLDVVDSAKKKANDELAKDKLALIAHNEHQAKHESKPTHVVEKGPIFVPESTMKVVESGHVVGEVHKVTCRYLGGLDNRAWVSCDDQISSVREGDKLPFPYGKVSKVDAQNGDIETDGGVVR